MTWLKGQFINGINDNKVMTVELTKKLTTLKDNAKMKSEHALIWVKKWKLQRSQITVLESIRDRKNTIKKTKNQKYK